MWAIQEQGLHMQLKLKSYTYCLEPWKSEIEWFLNTGGVCLDVCARINADNASQFYFIVPTLAHHYSHLSYLIPVEARKCQPAALRFCDNN